MGIDPLLYTTSNLNLPWFYHDVANFCYPWSVLGKIIILLAGSSMALATAEIQQPRTYTPQEVENIPLYQKAPMSDLVAVPKPTPQAPVTRAEIPQAIREAITRRLKELAKGYGVKVSGDISISGSDKMLSVSYQAPEKTYLVLSLNSDGSQVTHAMVQNVRLEDATTPEQLEKRFADFHRRSFGFDLPVESQVGDRVRVERSIQGYFARWRVTVDGVLVGGASAQATPDPRDGRWIIQGTPCPKPSEVKEIADWLQKEPTKITEAEAVAIGWKNWKSVRSAPDRDNDFRITCQLRKGSTEEREPWGVFGVIDNEPKAWKNMATVSDSPDPVFYEIQFTKHFYTVSVLIDRMDGKVIRIHQGQRGW